MTKNLLPALAVMCASTALGQPDDARRSGAARAGDGDGVAVTAAATARTLSFSGYTWNVKASGGAAWGPGSNVYSDAARNVWVDEAGRLHLKITQEAGVWTCAEVLMMGDPLGFGTYEFEVLAFDVRQGAGKRGLQLTYDADRQEMHAELALDFDTPVPGAWLETFFAATRIAVRNAKTVMGVPFRVETWSFSSMGLSVRRAAGSVSMQTAMPTALAQSVKPHLRALAVVRLDAPFAVHEVQTKTASLDSPTESRFAYLGLHAIPLALLLYDPRDGRVYARRVGRF